MSPARGSSTLDDSIALLEGLIVDDQDTKWGEIATTWQKEAAVAILAARSPQAVRMFFLTRPRGGSKTTDLAAVLLVILMTQAPRRSTSHAYARDLDQAGILLDALRALAERSGLAGEFVFGADRVTYPKTGALLRVESADAGSAFGRLPYVTVVDEVAAWPQTRQARTLWEAIVSGLPKRKDSRLVVLTSAGDPAHFAAKIIEGARASERWMVAEVPGPLPWADPDDLREQQRLLPGSVYARLHLNVWTASEDRLVSDEDLRACVVLDGPLEYDPAHGYVIGLDLGLKEDRTVMAVMHAERQEGAAPRVVLDRIAVLQGSRAKPVDLAQVERLVEQASRTYGHAKVRTDPWQAVGLAQRLRDRGVEVEEWAFTAQSVGRLGQTLHLLLRDHRLALPDDADLLDELLNVRLRETVPGVYRLDHDAGNHDDRAVALGLAALNLVERGEGSGHAQFSIPGNIARQMGVELGGASRRAYPGAPGRPSLLNPAYRLGAGRGTMGALRRAAREMPTGINSLPVEGSANSPDRVTRERRG